MSELKERLEIHRARHILEKKVGTKFPDDPIDQEWVMDKIKLEILKKYDKEYWEE